MKFSYFIFLLPIFSVYASEGEPILKSTFGGQGRFRFESSDRTDYASQRAGFLLRIRPEIKLSKGSEVSLFLQPQFSKTFGKPELVGASTTANSSQTTSGTTYDTALGIHQATIEYQPSETLRFTIGRQVFSYGNELVLSGLDWDNTGRSFDGLRGRFTHSAGWIDGLYSRLFASKSTATAVGFGDADLLGVYSNNDLGTGFNATDFYALYRKSESTGPNLELFVLGSRIQSKVSSIDYRIEVTKEFGSQLVDAGEAYQADAELGMAFESPCKSRLSLEYFRSGSDYDQMYPLGHKYLGIADVLGRRNLHGGAIHVSATPATDFSIQMDWHYFLRTSTAAPVFKLNGSTSLGSAGSSSSTVGMEGDLILNYSVSKEITATLGGGILFPGDYLKDTFGDTKPTFWYTQLSAQL